MRIRSDIASSRRVARLEPVQQVLSQAGLHGDVHSGADNFIPWSQQDDMRRFRIKPKIEFVPGRIHEFRIVSLWTQTRSHENQFFREADEIRIDRDSKRE